MRASLRLRRFFRPSSCNARANLLQAVILHTAGVIAGEPEPRRRWLLLHTLRNARRFPSGFRRRGHSSRFLNIKAKQIHRHLSDRAPFQGTLRLHAPIQVVRNLNSRLHEYSKPYSCIAVNPITARAPRDLISTLPLKIKFARTGARMSFAMISAKPADHRPAAPATVPRPPDWRRHGVPNGLYFSKVNVSSAPLGSLGKELAGGSNSQCYPVHCATQEV